MTDRVRAALALAMGALIAGPAVAQGRLHSVYTSIAPDRCSSTPALTREFAAQGLGVQECRGVDGWRVLIVSSNEHTWFELRSARVTWSAEQEIVYDRPLGQFSTVGAVPRLEWRVDARGVPHAIIVRVTARSPENPDRRLERLLIVGLDPTRVCVVGTATTNRDARRLADQRKDC
jgi:hypothetical protein